MNAIMSTDLVDELATSISDTPVLQKQRKGQQPFHLSIKVKTIDGKSVIPFAYPHKYLQTVTEKFYSKYQQQRKIKDSELAQIKKQYEEGPKEKLTRTILESQEYGWYSHIRFDIKSDYSNLLRSNF